MRPYSEITIQGTNFAAVDTTPSARLGDREACWVVLSLLTCFGKTPIFAALRLS